MSVFPLAHPSIRFHHFAPSNHRTTSAHRYPTCPSLLRYHHFDPSYYISPSLSHLPVRHHHFDSSHYTSPSLSHLPILQSDIITSIHRTISARRYPTCPSSNPIHHFDSSAHRYPTYPSFNPISSLRAFEPSHHISPSLSYLPILTPISSLRFIALYQPTTLRSTYHGKSLLSGQSTVLM